ncbi:putative NADH:flavin oxidoreductase [Pectobacterium atrosepticum SCRI1043]|uniref:NADH:flavin oxidoreductase n=1 Tax=Pectobacterium atrosepticum (strain SCRI 1043 / ATCC BAA-672) TaxID=218491 RepID=Q6D321_PECAS|nr:NADH-dependent flavin oxidoreductase [Pectobacterium atrosepticum]GKV84242.1 NADH-dependent flavin oxidoreductase [Pectobacterium carotovorum subsp. carotovorum]AIA71750.1 NADH:flavin oxidoreductase [Pectobacterium atrosepticum]AIK14707.1 putative NADH:flavin oxidoreductase [Pectobacterium atrosepticum]ATY91446.1 NADH:flavin oxidoreductase [Pectobacterium atrosepticum]KFX17617.1 NADH:flavin oxidoreductase [Pectobacterium atrosepticum]
MPHSDLLFDHFRFENGMTLRNRVVMTPMTTWSANPDGTISDQEAAYVQARAKDVGMVITGCTHVTPEGIGFTDEFAAYDDRFIPSLRKLAQAAKSGGASAILQIFHAGSKAVPELVPNGRVVGPSTMEVPAGLFNNGGNTATALRHSEIESIIKAFGDATRRAIEAGFDGVELHGAHGFLLQDFFSPLANNRDDEWGGSLDKRLRFPLSVVQTVRQVISAHTDRPFLLGYRISPEEQADGGLRIADTKILLDRLIDTGVDYIHASLHDVLNGKPIVDDGGKTTARLLIEHVADRVPLIAAGGFKTPTQAQAALDAGLSLAAIGQALIMNPNWVALAKAGREEEIVNVLNPASVQDLNIPEKLWTVIQQAKGWFPLVETEQAVE